MNIKFAEMLDEINNETSLKELDKDEWMIKMLLKAIQSKREDLLIDTLNKMKIKELEAV